MREGPMIMVGRSYDIDPRKATNLSAIIADSS